MKTSWQIKKLGEVCIIKPPKIEARKKLKENDFVSFVPMEDLGILSKYFTLNRERRLKEVAGSYTYFADGDILLAKITPCFENGKLGIAHNLKNGIGFGSSEYIVFRPNNDLLSEYIFYFLSDDVFRRKGRNSMSGAVGHKRVSKEFIENYPIPLPPLPEQHRIVKILDEVFEKIARAKENTEKNLQNSKDLFESYLQSIFSNPGKGWEEQVVGNFLKLEYGKPLDRKDRKANGKFPVYGANGEKDRADKYYYNKKTIIIGRKGSAGELNLTEEKFWPLDVTYFVTFDDKKYDLKFIYFLLSTLRITNLAKGVKPGINRNDVYLIDVFTPDLKEQKSIVAKLDALSAETKKLEGIYKQKLADLEELKKSVLKKAFRGEL